MNTIKEEELLTINGGDNGFFSKVGFVAGYLTYYLMKGVSYTQPSAFEIMEKSREKERNKELLLQGLV
jgi:hypothetical protein